VSGQQRRPLYRPLYCPVCGQRVEVETDGQYPEVLRLPDHAPRDAVNLCSGAVVTVTLDFDRCGRCGRKMTKSRSGLCQGCFVEQGQRPG
jgi:rRNA maturation protein Nop10